MKVTQSESGSQSSARLRVAIVIPTYNEADELRVCLSSLSSGERFELQKIVVNAGDPLPAEISHDLTEIQVPSDHFWTSCIEVGFTHAKANGFDIVGYSNADIRWLPGALESLVEAVQSDWKTIACVVGYDEQAEGEPKLAYANQLARGILLIGQFQRPWKHPSDAPDLNLPTDLLGGQGGVFDARWLDLVWPDAQRFPHYAGDYDLGLSMKANGGSLVAVAKAGVVNQRELGKPKPKSPMSKVKKGWFDFVSGKSSTSLSVVWNLRRKHLHLPLALLSTICFYPLRWAIKLRNAAGLGYRR